MVVSSVVSRFLSDPSVLEKLGCVFDAYHEEIVRGDNNGGVVEKARALAAKCEALEESLRESLVQNRRGDEDRERKDARIKQLMLAAGEHVANRRQLQDLQSRELAATQRVTTMEASAASIETRHNVTMDTQLKRSNDTMQHQLSLQQQEHVRKTALMDEELKTLRAFKTSVLLERANSSRKGAAHERAMNQELEETYPDASIIDTSALARKMDCHMVQGGMHPDRDIVFAFDWKNYSKKLDQGEIVKWQSDAALGRYDGSVLFTVNKVNSVGLRLVHNNLWRHSASMYVVTNGDRKAMHQAISLMTFHAGVSSNVSGASNEVQVDAFNALLRRVSPLVSSPRIVLSEVRKLIKDFTTVYKCDLAALRTQSSTIQEVVPFIETEALLRAAGANKYRPRSDSGGNSSSPRSKRSCVMETE